MYLDWISPRNSLSITSPLKEVQDRTNATSIRTGRNFTRNKTDWLEMFTQVFCSLRSGVLTDTAFQMVFMYIHLLFFFRTKPAHLYRVIVICIQNIDSCGWNLARQVAFGTLDSASAYSVRYVGPPFQLLSSLSAPACLCRSTLLLFSFRRSETKSCTTLCTTPCVEERV